MTEVGVPPMWRHMRRVGQSVAGRGQVQVSGVNKKHQSAMDIDGEYNTRNTTEDIGAKLDYHPLYVAERSVLPGNNGPSEQSERGR